MTFKLPELPYSQDALEPFLSRSTLETHHGKHHRGYVEKLNKQIEETEYAGLALEEIIRRAHAANDPAVFNNAAQCFNHSFLWNSMSPDGGGAPTGSLEEALNAAFGNFEGFRKAFRDEAVSHFGSGWTWLVRAKDGLHIRSTSDAETPIVDGLTPLLTLDVWEHAYYLDYKNERPRYVDAFLSEAINWSFAQQNFEAARAAA